jgi:hypothetical protein
LMGACGMIAALMSLWLAIETRGVNLERLSEATLGLRFSPPKIATSH